MFSVISCSRRSRVSAICVCISNGLQLCAEMAVHKYCNSMMAVSAGVGGYMKSPGYPLYYLGGITCGWTFRSQPGQRILLTLHDLSIRSKELFHLNTLGNSFYFLIKQNSPSRIHSRKIPPFVSTFIFLQKCRIV